MPDVEKVLNGIEEVRNSGIQCPLENVEPRRCCHFPEKLIDDIVSLLKEREPRLMTLEEAKNADFCFCEAGSLSVCRIVFNSFDGWVTIQQFGRPDMEIDSNEYGIAFRCWTSKPSKEQMEVTPWQ